MSNQISLHTREIWIQISWESMEYRHSPGGISEIGHATPSQLSLGPCVIGQANSRCHACAAKANGLSRGLRVCILLHTFVNLRPRWNPGSKGPPAAETVWRAFLLTLLTLLMILGPEIVGAHHLCHRTSMVPSCFQAGSRVR